jgi:hypothetical protein
LIKTICTECGKTVSERKSPLEMTQDGLCRPCQYKKEREAGHVPPTRRRTQKCIIFSEEAIKAIDKAARKAKKSPTAWCRGVILEVLGIEDTVRSYNGKKGKKSAKRR